MLASKSADYIMLVNKKHTEPIQKALLDEKFPSEKIGVYDTFMEAMEKAVSVPKGEKEKFILLENDLPDNYS